jgi:hypothetical protein
VAQGVDKPNTNESVQLIGGMVGKYFEKLESIPVKAGVYQLRETHCGKRMDLKKLMKKNTRLVDLKISYTKSRFKKLNQTDA